MSNFELSDSQIYAPEQLSPTLAGESDLFQVRFLYVVWFLLLVAQKAGVKRLVISYHHSDDDDFLDHVQTEIQSVFPKALLAREGLILSIN